MNDVEQIELLVTARFLEQGRALDILSTALTVAAAAVILAGLDPLGVSVLVLALGCAAKYLAVRVGLDARLFADLASMRSTTQRFDEAMTGLGLMPAEKAGRAWQARCRSARRLLEGLAILAFLQCLLVGGAFFVTPPGG